MIRLIASLTIAGTALIGGAGLAHAAPSDTPWGPGTDGLVHLPNGTCYQPLSNPPMHVACDSTRATTPYVSGETFPDDPTPPPNEDVVAPDAAELVETVIPTPRPVKHAEPRRPMAAYPVEMPPFAAW